MRSPVLALCITVLVADAAPAQEPTTGGFLFSYAPRDRQSFEPGYRRHLEWHRARADSLSWFGWDVLVGARPGVFVDGVFGVPFRALDVRVDPAGDQADAAANVLPYAEPVHRELIALRPDLSTATPLETGTPTAFVQVVRYPVAPGAVADVDSALSVLRREAAAGSLFPYTVYEHVAGAEPGFLIMIWRDRLATFDEHSRNPDRALRDIIARRVSSADGHDIIRTAGSEVWLYRRDLSHPGSRQEER